MAIEIKLPELGTDIESGDVLEVLVAEGETIEIEQGIIELETDKASMAIPSTHAGTVVKVHVSEGDTISSGAVLITLEPSEAVAKSDPVTPDSSREPVDSASATPPPPAPREPELTPPQEAVESPEPAPAASAAEVTAGPMQRTGEPIADLSDVPAGPSVRRFAREVGIDLRNVTGSGSRGRITRDDVLRVVRAGGVRQGSDANGGGKTDDWGPIHLEKLSKIRKTIANKMHQSWSTIPRVTNFDDADVTDLEEMRQSSKADYATRGIKLTSLPFLIKALATALKSHPVINASIDMDANQIIYKDYVNIGIAVDTERGLVVPALRNADQLSIPEIARSISELAEKVRDNKFSIDDIRGGTFTVSNLGAVGGTYSTPIINFPETAILLVGRSRKMPAVVENQVQIRMMMPLSISYDHRLIDGAAAARFLNEVISYLESPGRLLLAP